MRKRLYFRSISDNEDSYLDVEINISSELKNCKIKKKIDPVTLVSNLLLYIIVQLSLHLPVMLLFII